MDIPAAQFDAFVSGLLVAGYIVASMFFLRYWKRTRDRLFAMFAAAFGVLALQRLALTLSTSPIEDVTHLYVIRLAAFVIILVAIIDKNRS